MIEKKASAEFPNMDMFATRLLGVDFCGQHLMQGMLFSATLKEVGSTLRRVQEHRAHATSRDNVIGIIETTLGARLSAIWGRGGRT